MLQILPSKQAGHFLLIAYGRSQVGKDANAALLRDALSEAGVRLDHLREVEGPSGTAVVLLQPSGAAASLANHLLILSPIKFILLLFYMHGVICAAGENSIIIVGGANMAAWEFDDAALDVSQSGVTPAILTSQGSFQTHARLAFHHTAS